MTQTRGTIADTEWVFTFGPDHRHPVTGESLERRYTVISAATAMQARDKMMASYGVNWAFQYRSALDAGVDQHGLVRVPFMTPEEIHDARVTHLTRLVMDELSRPLWVFRSADALVPRELGGRGDVPLNPRKLGQVRGALTRRRRAGQEILNIITRHAATLVTVTGGSR